MVSGQWPVASAKPQAITLFVPALRASSATAPLLPIPRALIPLADLEAAFSRGFCHGWLDGRNDRALVVGASSAKRGVYLGEVRTAPRRANCSFAWPPRSNVATAWFSRATAAEATNWAAGCTKSFRDGRSIEGPVAEGLVELAFRHGAIEPDRLRPGQKVWKTDEPQLRRRLRKTYAAGRYGRRVAVDIVVEAAVGRPLVVSAATATGAACRDASSEAAARGGQTSADGRNAHRAIRPAGKHALRASPVGREARRPGDVPLERAGNSAARDVAAIGGRRIAAAETNRGRRVGVGVAAETRSLVPMAVGARGRLRSLPFERGESGKNGRQTSATTARTSPHRQPATTPHLHVLCRWPEQIAVALECGVSSVIADFQDLQRQSRCSPCGPRRGDGDSVGHPASTSPRPRWTSFERLAGENPDGLLVRNLAGLSFCRQTGLPAVADFSLNAVNDLTFAWLCQQGACRVTAAYDLNVPRLLDLASAVEPGRLEVVVDWHTPLFHAEYCLFCRTLSPGRNRGDCGRPCRRHKLRLRDRRGVEHPVSVDGDCRTTVFHADAQNLSDAVPSLLARGVAALSDRIAAGDQTGATRGGSSRPIGNAWTVAGWRSPRNEG